MTVDACDLLCLDLPHAEAVRAALPGTASSAEPAGRAKALGDATRLRVAAALAVGGQLCVCDIAWVCGLAPNLASHHVRVLRQAGLAASRRDGRLMMYELTDQGRALLAVLLPGSPVTTSAPDPVPDLAPDLAPDTGAPTSLAATGTSGSSTTSGAAPAGRP